MAPVINGKAVVILDGLDCEVIYSIMTKGSLNGNLVVLMSSHGTITSGPCPPGSYAYCNYYINSFKGCTYFKIYRHKRL